MAEKCCACNGLGYILTRKVKDGMPYDYTWRCYCELGKKYTAWPEIPFEMAPEKPLGTEVQMDINDLPEEWREEWAKRG
jgi:hypothetical protein